MPTIQLVIPEEDRESFARQAAREGKTLDAWLLSLARQRVVGQQPARKKTGERFKSAEELRAYLRAHSSLDGPERELDWEEHLRNIDESRRQGLPDVE